MDDCDVWEYENCSGDLNGCIATPGCLHLDVSVPIEDKTWGGVKCLYRVP